MYIIYTHIFVCVHILLEYVFLSMSCVLWHLGHRVQRQTTAHPPAPFSYEGKGCKDPPRGSTIPRQSCGSWIKVSVPCQGWWCTVPEPAPMLTGTPGAQLSPSCWRLMLELPSRKSTVPVLGSAGLVLPASGAGGHRESTTPAKGFYFLPLKHHQSPPQTPTVPKRC